MGPGSKVRYTQVDADAMSFEDIIEAIPNCVNEDDLKLLIQSWVQREGYDSFLCAVSYPYRKFFAITTYPREWISLYNTRGYIRIDPVVALGHTTIRPFDWSEVHCTEEQKQFFAQAAEHGLLSGFSVPARGMKGQGLLLNVGSSRAQILGGPNRSELYSRALYMGQMIHLAVNRILQLLNSKEKDLAESITPQQRRCLELLSAGLTGKLIARELDVSTSRVTEIQGQLCKKFDVETREQLVTRAGILNLVGYDYVQDELRDVEGRDLYLRPMDESTEKS